MSTRLRKPDNTYINASNISTIPAQPIKTYRALITQTGTNAPTAIILENTLGSVPIYAYSGVGSYTITLPPFDASKFFINIPSTVNIDSATDSIAISAQLVPVGDDYIISLSTLKLDLTLGSISGINGVLITHPIEFILYP